MSAACTCAYVQMAPEISVAIDFGTTRSAWAYRVHGQADNKILVRIPDTAVAAPSCTTKTETVALIGRSGTGKLLAFGPAAVQRHIEESDVDEALFRWFKVALCENRPGHTDVHSVEVESTGGHTVPLLGVIKASLDYFKEDVVGFLTSTGGRPVRATDINWVLTVPAIYDDFAKNFMRRAAFEAGMIDKIGSTKLRLCLEPEAACLAVAMEDNPLLPEAKGKTMMVIDCGGGTVDITTYTVQSVEPLNLAEVVGPTGGVWGSTRVDNEFKKWLEKFLGDWFAKVDATEILLRIMVTWEQKKAEFSGQDESQPLRINLSELAQSGMTLANVEVRVLIRHQIGVRARVALRIISSGVSVYLNPQIYVWGRGSVS